MNTLQRFSLILAALIVLGIALTRVSPAQQAALRVAPAGTRNIQITPFEAYSSQSAKYQVIYDFDRQTATLVELDVTQTPATLNVMSIKSLTKVTPP